jgi:hypothetical protein
MVRNLTLENITLLGVEKIARIARIARIAQVLKGEKLIPTSEVFEIVHTQPHSHVDAIRTAIRQHGLGKMIDPQPSRQQILSSR